MTKLSSNSSFTAAGGSALVNLTPHFFVVVAIFWALLPARAQEQAPRIVFSPTLGVAQGFRVSWPNVQRTLKRRADTLPGGFAVRSVGRSIVDDHTAQQVAWHLARAIDAMNRARSYFDFAERTGASTISWYGSPIDVTVEPANAEGAVAMTWVSPSGAGARRDSEGRAVFRRDGFAAQLMATSTRGSAQEIAAIDAVAAR